MSKPFVLDSEVDFNPDDDRWYVSVPSRKWPRERRDIANFKRRDNARRHARNLTVSRITRALARLYGEVAVLVMLLAVAACSSSTGPRNCHWYYTRYTVEAVLVRPDSLAVGVPIPTDSVRICLASDPR